ncbi:hypothetical protein E2C01_076872 [Portunus trituberculatus]|uniref:Uncharacterized protein n=1 Tax=Portunus trituberculatus TaxID=210409 RepID=A0A5B7IEA8_PORTR|nr:hypothetical protein [Portunus trituberculatus]
MEQESRRGRGSDPPAGQVVATRVVSLSAHHQTLTPSHLPTHHLAAHLASTGHCWISAGEGEEKINKSETRRE